MSLRYYQKETSLLTVRIMLTVFFKNNVITDYIKPRLINKHLGC